MKNQSSVGVPLFWWLLQFWSSSPVVVVQRDKNSFLIRQKASTSKVEKTAKTNSKRVQHLLLGQTMQLVLRLKPVARQLQRLW